VEHDSMQQVPVTVQCRWHVADLWPRDSRAQSAILGLLAPSDDEAKFSRCCADICLFITPLLRLLLLHMELCVIA